MNIFNVKLNIFNVKLNIISIQVYYQFSYISNRFFEYLLPNETWVVLSILIIIKMYKKYHVSLLNQTEWTVKCDTDFN